MTAMWLTWSYLILTETFQGRCINTILWIGKLRLRESRIDHVRSNPALSEDKVHDSLSLANKASVFTNQTTTVR